MKNGLGVLGLFVVVACGRTEDGGNDPRGGSGGQPHVGGQGSGGANGGVGGKAGAGGSGTGGSTTGGHAGKGGAPNTGGIVDDAGGEGGAGGGTEGDSVPLGESSWNTTLALTITKSVGITTITCNSSNFTLHVSPSGNDLKVISGADGAVLVGEFAGDGKSNPSYFASPAVPVPAHGDCQLQSMTISQLALHASDADGDGTADGIDGTGKASGTMIVGDVGYTAELDFTLKGVPDTTKPSLSVPSNQHPLDNVALLATEPVAVNSSVTLMSTGAASATPLLSGYPTSSGAFGRFYSSLILPFGSSWKVNATGGDLANLPFDIAALPPIAVLADPGLFAQDGFESTPALTLTGAAKIVTSVGTIPAIAGSKSLFVPPNSSATLHLSRASAASSVRFTAQGLMSTSGGTAPSSYAMAGVIGGLERVGPTQSLANTPSTNTSDSAWPSAGPKQEVTLLLTESGPDVVIRFAPMACQGFCPPQQALLIDDLRVE